MNDFQPLASHLARAGIPARITNRSFVRNVAGRIVQMDILRQNGKEELRISVPEGDETEVQVLGIDREVQQAVLMVREPEREFVERIWNREKRVYENVVRKTSEEKRRFLVGMDECHLFIAQLTTGATTVQQAHRGLRPRDLPVGKAAKRLVRQGEWFFQPATVEELRRIAEDVAKGGVARNVRIGRARGPMRGRPHIVSESVLLLTGDDDRGRQTVEFVRGRVKHPDHRTIQLHEWHKVFVNTEDRATLSRFSSWVD